MPSQKVLITAGATIVPIDKVRAITNGASGYTGALIAQFFQEKGEDVTLLTSNSETAADFKGNIVTYRTFEDLYEIMKNKIIKGNFDVIIHSAAVSDYSCSAVCVMDDDGKLTEIDASKKISSNQSELYLKLTQTPKIIDEIRGWGFDGKLVKFKLQVDITDEELLEIARKSRTDSNANLIVANCLEWARDRAYIVDSEKEISIERSNLPKVLHERTCNGK